MRVIAGTARRLNLKTVPGMETRPTTDRIKETLFNILQPEMPECRFLDLFSGSGGIGIEALSRGAAYAVFVEKNPKACSCIRDNLSFTKLAEHGKLLNMDVLQSYSFKGMSETIIEMMAGDIARDNDMDISEAREMASQMIPDVPDTMFVLTLSLIHI